MTGETPQRDDGLQARQNRLIEDACAQVYARPSRVTRLSSDAPSAESPGRSALHPAAPLPDSFTGYELLREIHRGGQGVVYQAIQKSTKRKVAIKVMKEGPFASTADRARFEREAQVLAQLQHPNIVAIHDTGVAAGHHYLVMDYISGQPLDVHMASGQRSVEETLRLFGAICDAVNAAHLRGIIHRDLKPGNIRMDGNGKPHILDFGLAKLPEGASDASMMTVTGAFVGSAPWASPEQAAGVLSNIDTRTDVYSLGVILYQMLTAKLPYNATGSMREVLDRIQTAAPRHPSTIRRDLNDEVDTIVLKCLAKERERRYQTAGELARDVRHYLAGDPIEAKRDSVGYVLRKHLRRFKLPVTIAAAFVLIVTVGFVTSLTLWRQVVRERDNVETARMAEASERRLAEDARRQAEQRQAEAEAVTRFLTSAFASIDPTNARGREVSVREILDEAAKDIQEHLADQPLAEATIRGTIGKTYRGLGLYRQAESHLRAANDIHLRELGREHAGTFRSTVDLGVLLGRRGNYAEAEALIGRSLEIARRLFGEEHPDTLRTMNNLSVVYFARGDYAAAEKLRRDTLAVCRRVLGDTAPVTLILMNNLGSVLYEQGGYAEAEVLLRHTLKTRLRDPGDRDPATLRTMFNLALVLGEQGKYAEAEKLHRQVLETSREVNGNENPETLKFDYALTNVLAAQGKLDEARTHIITLIPQRKEAAERLHADPESLNDYAWLLLTCEPQDLRDPETALLTSKKAIEVSGGPVPRYLYTLALAYYMTGHIDQAIETQAQALATLSEVETAYRTELELALICFLRAKGDRRASESLDKFIARRGLTNGWDDVEVMQRAAELALLLHTSGEYLLHASFCRALHALRGCSRQGESGIAAALVTLASSLIEQEKLAEADAILSLWLDIQQRGGCEFGKEHSGQLPGRLNAFIERVTRLYESHEGTNPGNGHAEKAARWLEKLEEMERNE